MNQINKNIFFLILITSFLFSSKVFVSKSSPSTTRSCIANNCSSLTFCNNAHPSAQHVFSMVDIKNRTKEICKSGCWQLAKGGEYNPISIAESSPMLKVTASHVEINFSGNFIENTSTTQDGWIGIEVGYTPAELTADPTLTQPKDVVISNVHLKNFDCAIVIHKDVERVLIEDSVILDSSAGIVMLGNNATFAITCPTTAVAPDPDDRIKCASIVNCKIIGHGEDRRTSLVNLKTRFETTYSYDTDYFMPLRADRLNGNLLDVYTYSGILASHIRNLFISCTTIQCTGNSDFTTEADTTRTEAIGIIIRDSDEVSIQHTKTITTTGNIKAVGLQLERVCGINVYNSEFSYGRSAYIASGIETFPDFLAETFDSLCSGFDFTVEEFDLCEVKAEFQRSDVFATAIFLTATRGVNGEQVFGERNIGLSGGFGLITFTSADISFTDSSFTRNLSGAATATLKKIDLSKRSLLHPITRNLGGAGLDGVCAIGLQAEDTNGLTFNNTVFNNNVGTNSGRGVHLTTCTNCNFDSSTFSYNQGNTKRASEDADLRTAQDAAEISKQGPVLAEAITGGYGLIADETCERITIQNCKAEHNSGHRSAGMLFKDSNRISITNSSASYQNGTGEFLSSDVQSLTPGTVTFPAAQQPLFASDACAADPTFTTVDYTDLLRDSLDDVREVRESQNLGATPVFTNEEGSVAGISLATSSMARFRLWGTAIGIHIHNGKHIILQNNTCTGQTTSQDNAIGILISGRSSEFEVTDCNLSYNEAWTDSAQALWANSPDPDDPEERYQYDLSAMKDFWYFTSGQFANGWDHAATTSDIGLFTGVGKAATDIPDVLIAQGEQTFGNAAIDGGLPFVRPGGGAAGNNRNLIPLVAPTAAGLLLADLAVSGYIANNLMNGNVGNSGHGFGLSFQNGFSMTVADNNTFNNGANIYGFGTGILDIASYSPNTYVRNFFTNNKVKKYVNANTFIPMGNIGGQSLQLDSLDNGLYNRDTRNLHNLELTLPLTDVDACTVESDLDGSIQSRIVGRWNAGNWIA